MAKDDKFKGQDFFTQQYTGKENAARVERNKQKAKELETSVEDWLAQGNQIEVVAAAPPQKAKRVWHGYKGKKRSKKVKRKLAKADKAFVALRGRGGIPQINRGQNGKGHNTTPTVS